MLEDCQMSGSKLAVYGIALRFCVFHVVTSNNSAHLSITLVGNGHDLRAFVSKCTHTSSVLATSCMVSTLYMMCCILMVFSLVSITLDFTTNNSPDLTSDLYLVSYSNAATPLFCSRMYSDVIPIAEHCVHPASSNLAVYH